MKMLSKTGLVQFVAVICCLASWFAFIFVTAFYGLWMQPIVSPEDSNAFFDEAVSILQNENANGNSALVMFEQGEIAHEYYSDGVDRIDENTVFSTASMSKWIAAAGVMNLVQAGELQLDDSVSQYLTRWQLPQNGFDNSKVTIRRLLSHTAGFADGLGFGDYLGDERLPTVEESLRNPRASSSESIQIGVSVEPGTEWIYSGGGYLVLELLIEEVTGIGFEEYMQMEVFNPLGMSRTSYILISEFENNAGSFNTNGKKASIYHYASSAATGFASTAADLSKFVSAQIPNSNVTQVLSSETVDKMLKPHGRSFGADIWGLGTMLYAPSPDGNFVFGHDGANEPAINSTARINPATGDAIIILETGHPSLATQLGSQWVFWQTGYPDFLDVEAVISSMILPMGIGSCVILLTGAYIFVRKKRQSKAR